MLKIASSSTSRILHHHISRTDIKNLHVTLCFSQFECSRGFLTAQTI